MSDPHAIPYRAAADRIRRRQALRFWIADRLVKQLGLEIDDTTLEILTDNLLRLVEQFDEDVK